MPACALILSLNYLSKFQKRLVPKKARSALYFEAVLDALR